MVNEKCIAVCFFRWTIKNNKHSPTNSQTERVHEYFSLLRKSEAKQMEFSDCISTLALVTFSDILVITGKIGCGFVKRGFGNVFRNFHR